MRTTLSITIAIAALLIGSNAIAGNSNGCQGNCSGGDTTSNTYNQGGTASAGAAAISGSYSGGGDASIGDVTNIAAGGQGGRGGDGGNALAFGGAGGKGGESYAAGGDAKQAQKIDAKQSTVVDASGRVANDVANDNRSEAKGNTTLVSTKYERNAPPVYLGNVAATVSCAGGFSAGSSSQGGAGALGFNWISPDCKTVVAGQNLQSLGMVDVACRVFKTTDGFKRAAKRDPSLNDVDCSIAK